MFSYMNFSGATLELYNGVRELGARSAHGASHLLHGAPHLRQQLGADVSLLLGQK
jgi:hypothetical protein